MHKGAGAAAAADAFLWLAGCDMNIRSVSTCYRATSEDLRAMRPYVYTYSRAVRVGIAIARYIQIYAVKRSMKYTRKEQGRNHTKKKHSSQLVVAPKTTQHVVANEKPLNGHCARFFDWSKKQHIDAIHLVY